MARTVEQIIKEQIAEYVVQLAAKQAELEALKEQVAILSANQKEE